MICSYKLLIFLQVVSQYSNLLAPISVDAVLKVIDPKTASNVNLKDIRVITKLGYANDDDLDMLWTHVKML